MIEIGKVNKLKVIKKVDFGLYLGDGTETEILLPERYVPSDCKTGDEFEVFVYLDSEDRVIATTETPYAQVGDFACLKVAAVTSIGAFLDWGLSKDLFVPFNEQQKRMEEGQSYVVRVYVDSSDRIAASSKLGRFISKEPANYSVGDAVSLIIWERTDLGYKALINGIHIGLIFEADVFQDLNPGDQVAGFIKQVRPDGKIDLYLHAPGYEKVGGVADEIMSILEEDGGFITLNDKSDPDEIYAKFKVSKKTYKKAIGNLYKKRLITIDDDGIRIVK